MARATQRSREEIELELLAFKLTERRFALGCRAVLLAATVASMAVTIALRVAG
jgi:hypothetical protein